MPFGKVFWVVILSFCSFVELINIFEIVLRYSVLFGLFGMCAVDLSYCRYVWMIAISARLGQFVYVAFYDFCIVAFVPYHVEYLFYLNVNGKSV